MTTEWRTKAADYFVASPVTFFSSIFAVTIKGTLSKIDTVTGNVKEEIGLNEPVFNSPVGFNEEIFVSSVSGYVFILTGKLDLLTKVAFLTILLYKWIITNV